MTTRRYTVEMANRALPYVRSIVRDVMELYKRIQELSGRHSDTERDERERRQELRTQIEAAAERLHACQEELWEIGVELKDYELGLVDFPAELEGRPILLCWKYGEEAVDHWHETEAGFSGRQPVPTDDACWPSGGATVSPAARE